MESKSLQVKAGLCLFIMLLFVTKGIYELVYSDAQSYRENIEQSLKGLSFTVSYVKCHKQVKTSSYVELGVKENNKVLYAYAGSKCLDIENRLTVGDYIGVDAILENSDVVGIIKNGKWLMETNKTINGRVSNFTNYYLIYLTIGLVFFLLFRDVKRKGSHT